MRSVYLFLAVTTALVTCKRQHSNNDIVWYPVEEEDGVFISIYGERHRTPPRSHRRARFSGQETGSFFYSPYQDTAGNENPPFFHNSNNARRHRSFPETPSSFQHQPNYAHLNNPYPNPNNPYPINPYPNNPNLNNPYPNNPFISQAMNKQPQNSQTQDYDAAEFQEILNEVFELDKHLPAAFPKKADVAGNPNGRRISQSAQFIEEPTESKWLNNPERPHIPIRPPQVHKQNLPNRPRKVNPAPKKPSRTTLDPDALIFPDQTTPKRRRTTTPATLTPTEAPTMSPCERACPVTPEFNPVCGTDSITYSNAGRLKCAQMCGKDVVLAHYGNCGRSRLVTPPLSDDPWKKKKGNRRTR